MRQEQFEVTVRNICPVSYTLDKPSHHRVIIHLNSEKSYEAFSTDMYSTNKTDVEKPQPEDEINLFLKNSKVIRELK